MKIPHDLDERDNLYMDVINKCLYSQSDRNTDYGLQRHYYLFGRAPDDEQTPYNKIYSHIDLLTAFLFASETTKFHIHLPPQAEEVYRKRSTPLAKAVNDCWLNSNSDSVFSQCITWALVFNTMMFKIIPRVVGEKGEERLEINPFPLDPGCFGVLREDLPYTDRQEAMVHTFYTTLSQLEIDLKDHKDRNFILSHLSSSRVRVDEKPTGLQKIMISATTPSMIGNVNQTLTQEIEYRPKVAEDLVELQELWIWDDALNDYRVITRAENGVTIYDRQNFFLENEHPFVQVCPSPLFSYYWGMSEVQGLCGLQKWRNDRVTQIRKLLDLQVRPPTAMTGWMGLLEEKNYAAFADGGFLSTDSPTSKLDRFSPELPADLFGVIHEIDQSFAEQSGLQNIMQGKGEAGVRSGRQTTELARLASARIKKRALVIEDALEKIATLYLKLLRKYDTTKYEDEDHQPFTADQFTDDFVVKVDAHSNSPLFTEDQKEDARFMLENHVIDRDSYLDITSPPDVDNLKRRLTKIENAEAAAAQAKEQAEAAKGKPSHA